MEFCCRNTAPCSSFGMKHPFTVILTQCQIQYVKVTQDVISRNTDVTTFDLEDVIYHVKLDNNYNSLILLRSVQIDKIHLDATCIYISPEVFQRVLNKSLRKLTVILVWDFKGDG